MTFEEFKKKWGTETVSVVVESIVEQKLLGPRTEALLLEIADDLRSALHDLKTEKKIVVEK